MDQKCIDLTLVQDSNKLVSSITLYIQGTDERLFHDIIRLASLIHDSLKTVEPTVQRLK